MPLAIQAVLDEARAESRPAPEARHDARLVRKAPQRGAE